MRMYEDPNMNSDRNESQNAQGTDNTASGSSSSQGQGWQSGSSSQGGYQYGGYSNGYQSQGNSYNPNSGWQSSPYGGNGQDSSHQYQGSHNSTPNEASEEPYKWNFADYNAGPSPKKPKKNKGLAVFGVLIAAVLVVGIMSFAGYGVYSAFQLTDNGAATSEAEEPVIDESVPNLTIQDRPADTTENTSSDGRLTTEQVAEKVIPSVVGIVQYQRANGYSPAGEGSGIIMTADGYIVTNYHVVSGAEGIKVVLNTGEEYSATIVGLDERTDLAVIKIDAQDLPYAEFGNSDQLQIGETVIAIGNPGGLEFASSVTKGIVSAVNRPIKSETTSMNAIQTDAAINPGNSGGALVNEYGQVIGINSAKIAATDYEGIGFAIPVNEAKPIIDDLIQYQRVTGRVKIGITAQEIDQVLANLYGVPSGILIVSIEDGADIGTKGVVPGDIITQVEGQAVNDMSGLRDILDEKEPGDTITLTIFRRTQGYTDRTFEVSVVLEEDMGSSVTQAVPQSVS